MFFVTFVSYRPEMGLVLTDQSEGFFSFSEAKNEIDRLYKESSFNHPIGLVVGAFVVYHSGNRKQELLYASVIKDTALPCSFTCPVCKKQAKPRQSDFGPIIGKWFVFCDTCASRTGFYDTEDEAIEAWHKLTGKEG